MDRSLMSELRQWHVFAMVLGQGADIRTSKALVGCSWAAILRGIHMQRKFALNQYQSRHWGRRCLVSVNYLG